MDAPMSYLRKLASTPCAGHSSSSAAAKSHGASTAVRPHASDTITKGGMISGERSVLEANEHRGMLEVRHKGILARIDILNQLNTQAMLIASA